MTTATNSRYDLASGRRMNWQWTVARPWQTNAALLLIGMGLFFLTRQLVSEYSHFTIGFSGVSGWSCILYLSAAFLVLTQPVDRFTFPIILAVAIACRLADLLAGPYLSSDIYRYVWDGVVQHAHISPYRYVPGDPVLAFLRAPHQDIFDNINRRDYAHTIYPPAAQALFYVVTWVSPTVTFMKTVMILFEGVTMYALVTLLGYLGIRREQAFLYAWCPLLIWEIAGSGHLDSAAMAFIALALLARYREQPVLTGLFLAVAILLKFYPLVLLPALLLPRHPSPAPKSKPVRRPTLLQLTTGVLRGVDWKMPITCFAIIAIGYAAYSSAGKLVFGFLGGYVEEEGMATGTRYFLLEAVHKFPGLQNLPPAVFLSFSALVFFLLTLWCLLNAVVSPRAMSREEFNKLLEGKGYPPSDPLIRDRNSERPSPLPTFLPNAFALATALMLLFSPHYAWYIIWLVPFFSLMPNLPILTYLLGFFYLYTTALAEPGPKMFLANEILYAAVFAAFLAQLAFKRWPFHRTFFVQPSTSSELL
jgi:hypothetical protein